MSFRRTAGFKAPTTGFVQRRGIVANDGFMRSFGDTEPAIFNLVRGTTQTYNVPRNYPETRGSFFLLDNAPAGITINADGIITAELPFIFDDPGDLVILNHGANITLPTTIRDWFPGFHSVQPTAFVSCFRSYSGAAGQKLFEVNLVPPTTSWDDEDHALVTGVQLMTGADGYIDLTPLETAFSSHDDAVALVTKVNVQGVGAIDADGNRFQVPDLNPVSERWGAFAYKASGGDIEYFTAPSGVRVWRGDFDLDDLESTWPDDGPARGEYRNGGDSDLLGEFSFSYYGSFRRRTNSNTGVRCQYGDSNLYPRFEALDPNSYRMNSVNDPRVDFPATPDIRTKWLCGSCSFLDTDDDDDANNATAVRVVSLQETSANDDTNTTTTKHDPGGFRILFDQYDMAEVAFYDQDNDMTYDEWQEFQIVIDNNLGAAIGNVTLAYS